MVSSASVLCLPEEEGQAVRLLVETADTLHHIRMCCSHLFFNTNPFLHVGTGKELVVTKYWTTVVIQDMTHSTGILSSNYTECKTHCAS